MAPETSNIVTFPHRRDEPAWQPIAAREGQGALDCWTEWLCLRRVSAGVEAATCAQSVVAEVPPDWFDDEGHPLPEFQDENGELKIPGHYNGLSISGIDGEFLLGTMKPVTDDAVVRIESYVASAAAAALASLNWKPDEVADFDHEVKRMFAACP